MDDAVLVGGFERLADLPRDWERLIDRNRVSRDALRERLPFDELHDERRDAAGVLEMENACDIRMIERCEDLCLTREPCNAIAIARDVSRKNLDRDLTPKLRVAGAIDLAHAAGAQGGDDLIRAEAS